MDKIENETSMYPLPGFSKCLHFTLFASHLLFLKKYDFLDAILPVLPYPSVPDLMLLQSTYNTQNKRWQWFRDAPNSWYPHGTIHGISACFSQHFRG